MQHFKELPINTGLKYEHPMDKIILEKMHEQFTYMTGLLSQCYLIRFELRLPTDSKVRPLKDNELVSEFFNRFVNKYLKNTKGHKHVMYFWVREVEKSKYAHYHCYIIVDRHKTQTTGSVVSRNGVMGKAADIWERVSGGGNLRIADAMPWGASMRRGHEISDDHQLVFCKKYNCSLPRLSETERAFYAVSYLAKSRGKGVRHGTKVRDFGMSRVPKAISLPVDQAA